MFLLIAYDAWFAGRVESLLKWLDAWLSISQRSAERAMIVIYAAFMLRSSGGDVKVIGFAALGAFLVGYLMWILHRRPAAMRNSYKRNRSFGWVRATAQLFLFLLAAWPFSGWTETAWSATRQALYVVFWYSTDISFDGDRGRKRKLALAELKRMFGAEWIAKPLPLPR
jgi:hypothetical protein